MSGNRPVAALSQSGSKLHLQHGPIDLIVTADGPSPLRSAAFRRAEDALQDVLVDLVAELSELRRPSSERPVVTGSVARRMVRAAERCAHVFITPMAAVAGAIADHVVAAAMQPGLHRLTVNNGGDIAFALAPGRETVVGLTDAHTSRFLSGTVRIRSIDRVRGVATSGWRGRSHSLGIADAVTVLGPDGASADAAASAIASAVDLPDHPAVSRLPACELQPDSDLGDRLVTVAVGELSHGDRLAALARGAVVAQKLLEMGCIDGALLTLGDDWTVVERSSAPILEGTGWRRLPAAH